ncbi:fungal-specific transcription factor domain-containing protein [Fusarium redolens]|uniref:Fungal-specific transcription factor domain-containing protein n=1 Tax=Fusarium redolens TaxID=48865 RepID=A0A9P9H265_FUSRE|nr:fungal-specific transcription factor domain-containing protein [Fusarium redolens]KAH7248948.1 fungal-specific transcription factor domain-containing protein [Fusarium redolens]
MIGRLERLLQDSQETRASCIEGSQYKCNYLANAGITPTSQDEDAVVRLGLYEEAPPRELIETLINIYFDRIHQVTPVLHRQRFVASIFLPDHMQPPMCLQYIVMASAAETSDIYRHLGMVFYKRAIKYLQDDDSGDISESSISLGHVQARALISCFEAEHSMFAKASITLCSTIRAAHMLNLHQVDITRPDSCYHVDWIGVEERRRTWWTIFCYDRFTCATTGWPALIHDHNIRTRLPASDEAYANGQEEKTRFLGDQLLESEPHSTFAGAVLAAHIFHRTIEHTGTNNSQDQEFQDFNGDPYWQRHKSTDNDLKFMLLMLPKNLCLPANYKTHNAIFVNVMLHTATICLHRAALWRMKSNLQGLPSYVIRLSQDRLLPAAEEILNIFRMIPDLGATFTNPLICFAAYMAALGFIASTSPAEPDGEHGQDLDFILKVLAALGNTNIVANTLASEIVKEMKQCGITSLSMNKVGYQYPFSRYANTYVVF